MRFPSFLLVGVLLLIFCVVCCDAKKTPKQQKKQEDVEVLDENQLEEKLSTMNKPDARSKAKDDKKKADERKKLEKELEAFEKKAELAKDGFGDTSDEYAKMIHALGRVVYKLGRYEDAKFYALEIVRIYETLYGVDDYEMSKALGNVGSVAYRLKDMKTCARVMSRALDIVLKEVNYDEGSKEALMHRAKMLTFGLEKEAKGMGISHEEYTGVDDADSEF